jgi:2-polyprenyl-6-hydroxyphenyl methylase/3-demethylubiquinone-9 3-methyltransferase
MAAAVAKTSHGADALQRSGRVARPRRHPTRTADLPLIGWHRSGVAAGTDPVTAGLTRHSHVTLQRMSLVLPRNDVRQYEEMAAEWWRPNGAFAMLHWIARARAALVPPATRDGAVLVDLGCGAGLLAPHVQALGYRHVGVDLVHSSLVQALDHGIAVVRGDVHAVPLADGCADVVSAGEILEHVSDPSTVVAQACRLLRPGGSLVLDTINATAAARFVAVTLGERIPGGAPKGIHDPALFVAPRLVIDECARHGVKLRVRGIRPAVGQLLWWLLVRRGDVQIVPTTSTAVLYQGWGVKEG